MNTETQFDSQTYETVKPYFKRVLEQVVSAGRSVRDFVDFTVDKFGDAIIPYVKRFLAEVEAGTIKLANLSQSSWEAIFGRRVTPEQHQQMIQEAAYFRAQQRGFEGGDAAQDWLDAEREIDAKLAEEMGLIGRGRQALVALTDTLEKELSDAVNSVGQWLSGHKPSGKGAH